MRAEAFIGHLEALRRGRAWTRARATLRRSLAFSPGSYSAAFPFVESLVEDGDGWRREIHYLVAGLYALMDGRHEKGRTLARAMAELSRDPRRSPESVERRFLALLDADHDQIAHRLRAAVTLIDCGFDFAQLSGDLVWWFHPERGVQSRWARDFYRHSADETKEAA